jgi:hypothetical protein
MKNSALSLHLASAKPHFHGRREEENVLLRYHTRPIFRKLSFKTTKGGNNSVLLELQPLMDDERVYQLFNLRISRQTCEKFQSSV